MARYRQAIPNAALPILDQCQQEYASNWDKNAQLLANEGHYAWMANFVRDYERIIEIGTGTGRSTALLTKMGHAVISVDENPACLRSARVYLSEQGIPTAVAKPRANRARVTDAPDHIAEPRAVLYAAVEGVNDPNPGAALLLEGDILIDPELSSWLHRLSARDAVVCWLMGIHKAVHFHAQLGFKGTDPHTYRVRVQNAVYKLADAVLRPRGILHIVDRVESDTKEVQDAFLAAHTDMSTLGDFSVESIDFRPYQLGSMNQEVQIQNHDGTIATDKSIFLCSVLVRKAG